MVLIAVATCLTPIVPISVFSAFSVVNLPHPAVVPAAKTFAIFVARPTGNGVWIAVLLAVVYIWPTVVPEVAFRTLHAGVEAPLLPCFLGCVLPIYELGRLVKPLRERATSAGC